jgi:predicted  nucleic acid-binding Zn-ribbon protein
MAFAQTPPPAPPAPSAPAGSGPVSAPPRLVEEPEVKPAPVAADANALAELAKEEKALMGQAKDITVKITALEKPLRDVREQAIKTDKDLQAINRAIADKQKALEVKLAEKYPEIAAKTKEKDDLLQQYSGTEEKLRDVRKKMDAIEAAMAKEAAEKKKAK